MLVFVVTKHILQGPIIRNSSRTESIVMSESGSLPILVKLIALSLCHFVFLGTVTGNLSGYLIFKWQN